MREGMRREAIGEGPSLPEALDAALEELGVQQDAVDYEIIEEGGKRIFGIGGDRATRVRVWLKDGFIDEAGGEDAADAGDGEVDYLSDSHGDLPNEVGPLSEEELDRVADEATAVLKAITSAMGIESTIEEYEGDEGELILDINGADVAILIGRHGKTLDALQVVVSAIVTRKLGFRHPVVVDVEGYRNRRREKIEDISRRAADRAARERGPVRLRPMTSFERRIVHVCLRDDKRVVTASEGEDPFRYVVVSPK